jgi:AcrR family transcriptional regulator
MAPSEEADSRRLPPGAHGLPPELIARNQRERLIAAMAEACAERGYAEVAVSEIVKRAGVSNATFYTQFADKRECLLAAHEELVGRLLEEVDRAGEEGGEPAVRIRAAIRLTLELLAADPPSARLLTVEVLAAGPEGMARQAEAIEDLASRLGASWPAVAAMTMLVGRLVMAGEAGRLSEFEDELVAIAVDSTRSDK